MVESVMVECESTDCHWGNTCHFSDGDIPRSLPNHPTQMLPPHLIASCIQVPQFVAKPILLIFLFISTQIVLGFTAVQSLRPGWDRIGKKISLLILAFYTLSCVPQELPSQTFSLQLVFSFTHSKAASCMEPSRANQFWQRKTNQSYHILVFVFVIVY